MTFIRISCYQFALRQQVAQMHNHLYSGPLNQANNSLSLHFKYSEEAIKCAKGYLVL